MEDDNNDQLDSLAIHLYGVLADHRVHFEDAFAILIGISAAIGNDANIPEEEMVRLLRLGIAEDKRCQHMEMQ